MKKRLWRLCCLGVLGLAVLTFTPLVTPVGTSEPYWLGIPRTLWAGIVIYLSITLLTWVGSRLYLSDPSKEKDEAS
jgi:membrane protease YdiL (CAAX protease family)